MREFITKVDENRSAWVEIEEYSTSLMICNNGYQSSGAYIGSDEVALATYETLGKYLKSKGLLKEQDKRDLEMQAKGVELAYRNIPDLYNSDYVKLKRFSENISKQAGEL